jgi:hypothetical protein
MVQEEMSHLEQAVVEVTQKMMSQQIPPKMAAELIERFHRIEEKISRAELVCDEHLRDTQNAS